MKPRAHQSQYADYWVVWSVEAGTIIQGVGRTLHGAHMRWYVNFGAHHANDTSDRRQARRGIG